VPNRRSPSRFHVRPVPPKPTAARRGPRRCDGRSRAQPPHPGCRRRPDPGDGARREPARAEPATRQPVAFARSLVGQADGNVQGDDLRHRRRRDQLRRVLDQLKHQLGGSRLTGDPEPAPVAAVHTREPRHGTKRIPFRCDRDGRRPVPGGGRTRRPSFRSPCERRGRDRLRGSRPPAPLLRTGGSPDSGRGPGWAYDGARRGAVLGHRCRCSHQAATRPPRRSHGAATKERSRHDAKIDPGRSEMRGITPECRGFRASVWVAEGPPGESDPDRPGRPGWRSTTCFARRNDFCANLRRRAAATTDAAGRPRHVAVEPRSTE